MRCRGPRASDQTPVQAGELFETWNGRVSRGSPTDGVEVNGWSLAASMPLARSEHAVAEMDGKVWVLGGYPPGRLPSNLVQVYNPARDRWSWARQLPQPIHHTMVAAVGGKLYMIGGEIKGASTDGRQSYVANVWMHDPAVGGWVARAPMPTREERRRQGGDRRQDLRRRRAPARGHAFEVYDPATDKWEKLPDLPTQRNHLAMVALNGKIFVAGGRVGTISVAERVTRWRSTIPRRAAGPTVRRFRRPAAASRGPPTAGACSCLPARAKRPTFWGSPPTLTPMIPRADRWTRLPDLPIAVHGLKGSAVIGGRVFLPGGGVTAGGNTGTNAVQVYRPTMRCE